MAIEWMSDEKCTEEFRRVYPDFRKNANCQILPRFSFDISSDELTQSIPFPPTTDPQGFNEPGPIDVWFGRSQTCFFDIVYYKGKNYAIVATHAKLSEEKYPWFVLKRFTTLPSVVLSNISGVTGHMESARVSVFFKDLQGIATELYRAQTESEAVELITFLKSIGCRREFYLSTADDLQETWIIVRIAENHPNEIVARYNSRIAAQRVAYSFSLRDGALYQSIRETPRGHSGVSFQSGKMIPA